MKIRTKLAVAMLAVTILTTGAILFFAVNTLAPKLQEEITDKLVLHGEEELEGIDMMLNDRLADIKVLSSRKHGVLVGSMHSLKGKLDYLRDFEQKTKMYASMSIYDKQGIRIGDTRGLGVGLDESEKPFFQHAIRGEIYSDSTLTFSESLGQYVIHFSGPQWDDEGNIAGVIVSKFPINRITSVFGEEEMGEVFEHVELLDDKGLVLFSNIGTRLSTKSEVAAQVFEKTKESAERAESMIDRHEEHETLYVGIKEEGYLDYKGNNWILVYGVDVEDVFAPLDDLKKKTIYVAAGAILFALILSLALSRMFSKPVISLREASEQIRKGNLDIPHLHLDTKDELEDVGHAFNDMVKGIKSWKQKTEQKSIMLEKVLKKLQQSHRKLQQLDKLKDEFIQSVSHAIRTPLTSMIGFIELVREEKFGKLAKKQKEAVATIETETARLNRIITRMILTSRMEAQEKLQYGKVDFNELVKSGIKKYETKAKEKKINFVLKLVGLPKLKADKFWLGLAVENLIDNALKFTQEGVITIRTRKTDSHVEFSVADTGIGVPKKFIPFLFTKFFQVTHTVSGSGLGLYLTYKIIKAHKGKIWCKSKVGKGSTFTFRIPISYQK